MVNVLGCSLDKSIFYDTCGQLKGSLSPNIFAISSFFNSLNQFWRWLLKKIRIESAEKSYLMLVLLKFKKWREDCHFMLLISAWPTTPLAKDGELVVGWPHLNVRYISSKSRRLITPVLFLSNRDSFRFSWIFLLFMLRGCI